MERGLVLLFLFFFLSFLPSFSMSLLDPVGTATAPIAAPTGALSGYIVSLDLPIGERPEHLAISTLSSVLGSEKAAKEALIYVFYNVLSGFAASLTAEQASMLKKQPGVVGVFPSGTLELF